MEIEQKYYGKICFDLTEKDVIILSVKQKVEFNLIQIERENIPQLIEILKNNIK